MDLNELFKNKEQIQGLITMLQTVLDAQDQQDSSTKEDKPKQNSKIKTRKSRKTVQDKNFVNKFESMSEFNSHKADTAIDKVLAKHPPVQRSRKFETIDVVCRVCGKNENVNPSLAPEGAARYKCNNCSRHSG